MGEILLLSVTEHQRGKEGIVSYRGSWSLGIERPLKGIGYVNCKVVKFEDALITFEFMEQSGDILVGGKLFLNVKV